MQQLNEAALASLEADGIGVKAVSLGGRHSAAIKEDNSLWTWGRNYSGQLGDGTDTDRLVPIKVLDDVVSVSLRYSNSAAIKEDGSLWMWGVDNSHQLGIGTTMQSLRIPTKVMDDVVSVSLGYGHSAAIKEDGSLWMWGDNLYGKIGNGSASSYCVSPVKLMDEVAYVALGYCHSAAIKEDGSLWTWGENAYGKLGDTTQIDRLAPVKIMDDVASASLGTNHSAAIKKDGTLWMWGHNDSGQLGIGTGISSCPTPVQVMDEVTQVSLGSNVTSAVKKDGSLWMWGPGHYPTPVPESNRWRPTKVMDGVAAISPVSLHGAAIKKDGSLWTWGENSNGQLGDGTTENHGSPVMIMGPRSTTINPNEPGSGSDNENSSSYENHLIERVRAYTSSSLYSDVINTIAASPNLSEEEKWQKMCEWANDNGYLDPREGTKFHSQSYDERKAYTDLINDKLYCAWHWTSWIRSDELVDTDSDEEAWRLPGVACRMGLYTSALIYNLEFVDYISPSTYINDEYPGVKKQKAMLLDFISADAPNTELIERLSLANDVLQQCADLLSDAEVKAFEAALKGAKDITDVSLVMHDMVAKINPSGASGSKISLVLEQSELADILGRAGKVLPILFATAEDLEYVYTMESNLRQYDKYREFLEEIQASEDIPAEIRIAAHQLQLEFESISLAIARKVMTQVGDFVVDGVVDAVGIADKLNGAVLVVSVVGACGDILFGLGDGVEKAASVEGYFYLGRHYKNELIKAHGDFLANQTYENALRFQNCYTTLLDLRIAGESAYLAMSKNEGILAAILNLNYAYDMKREHVVETLDTLSGYGFDLEGLDKGSEGKLYERKIIACCPVDLEIYDADGRLVYVIEDGAESDATTDEGRFIGFYNPFESGYSKVAYLNDIAEGYSVCLSAKDAGLVSCTISDKDEGEDVYVCGIDKQALGSGDTMEFELGDRGEKPLVEINLANALKTERMEALSDDIEVSEIKTWLDLDELNVGDTALVNVEVSPKEASNKTLSWVSSNPSVASVSAGKITAVSKGSATIVARTHDGGLASEITVDVIDPGAEGEGPEPTGPAQVKRLAGDTALDTMAKIAAQGFAKGSCDTVVVATMGGYWDALAASSLAGLHGCPVLLTSGSSLSDQAASEIRRLGARRAYIAGGAAAVSRGVESQIRAMGLSTERLAGDTAVGTAVEIYEEGVGSWGRTAVVATARSYHDALAASPYAYAHAAPVFLTDSANELSADALAAVEAGGFESVVICGGRAAVSGSVESQLRGIGVRSVRRLSGDTAYETAAAVSAWALASGMSAACVGVATGRDYYDALTGASLCGRLNAPLVLVGHGNASAAGFLRASRADVSQVYVFGGTAAVTADEYRQIQSALK